MSLRLQNDWRALRRRGALRWRFGFDHFQEWLLLIVLCLFLLRIVDQASSACMQDTCRQGRIFVLQSKHILHHKRENWDLVLQYMRTKWCSTMGELPYGALIMIGAHIT